MENPSDKRTEISAAASGLSLSIRPKRRAGRWSLLWAPLASAFWIYGMYEALGEVTKPDDNTVLLFNYLTLTGLIICGVTGFPAFFWSAFGREIVEVYAGRFIVAKELRSFRYRSKSFNTLDVEDLRADAGPGSLHSLVQLFRGRLTTPGNIAFEAQNTTHRFGAYLEEEEAREVTERIRRYLPNMRSRP